MSSEMVVSTETIDVKIPKWIITYGKIRVLTPDRNGNVGDKENPLIATKIDMNNVDVMEDLLPRFCDRFKVDDRRMTFTKMITEEVNGKNKSVEVRLFTAEEVTELLEEDGVTGKMVLMRKVEDLRPSKTRKPREAKVPTPDEIEARMEKDPIFAAEMLKRMSKRLGK